jgi:hypothetical protein
MIGYSALSVLRRAEVTKSRLRLASEAFQKRSHQSRFADARFTSKQHHLPFATFCFRPTPQQDFEFFLTSHKLREAACMQRLEPAFYRSWSQSRPGPHRRRDALEFLFPKVLQLEQVAEEPARALRNHDAVRLCDTLQAGGKIRRLADDCLLLRSAGPNKVADDHHTRRDA